VLICTVPFIRVKRVNEKPSTIALKDLKTGYYVAVRNEPGAQGEIVWAMLDGHGTLRVYSHWHTGPRPPSEFPFLEQWGGK